MFNFNDNYTLGIFLFLLSGGMFFLGTICVTFLKGRKLKETQENIVILMERSRKDVENLRKEAELNGKDMMLNLRQDFDQEIQKKREEIFLAENNMTQKDENIRKRLDILDKKEQDITNRIEKIQENEEFVREKEGELVRVLSEEKKTLLRIAKTTEREAKELLISKIDSELLGEKAVRIKKMEEEIKEFSNKMAQNIISNAIQKCSSEHTASTTVTVVMLPNDEMKGRIIGREGRNIRALEAAAGVDVIIDDTPEAVMISGFDIYRREIARVALEKLIEDGRIHPGRVEEIVEKAKKEMDVVIKEEGEKVAFDLSIHGMHTELLKLVGKLKFRTSYGQNGLQHTKEVSMLCGSMASQLGLDVNVAMRAGLLHDIGKVVSQDVEEGTHAIIGGNLSRKYGEKEEVVNAVESHHNEVACNTVYGVLVQSADAISAARPGARAETLETYVKRLENLEGIANSFKGVNKSFVLQAGREIRIIVDPNKINDDESLVMARDIRNKIEEEMEYPGQIKIIVLREKRAVEYAK